MYTRKDLAVNGGTKFRTAPWPGRKHVGVEEKAAVDALFDNVIATGNMYGYDGPEETAYCREFAAFHGGGFADGVNSGTTAVFVALKALNPEPFSEIIVGAVTDPGGIMPIVMLNCIPVVADAAPGCYNTGAAQIEELITERTAAILVAHLGGEPADMPAIIRVAGKHGIPVVEDCSQSHGAKINGRYVGTFGNIAAFSTMFGKHCCAGGQGGMVFTKDEALFQRVRWSSDRGKPYGLPAGSTNVIASLNFNLDELSSVIGRVQLGKLSDIVARRRRFAALLRAKGLDNMKSIAIPALPDGFEHSYWWWRLRVRTENLACSKDEFVTALAAEGVLLIPDYSLALPHTFTWFTKQQAFGSGHFPWDSPQYKGDAANREFPIPNARAACKSHFNLRLYESWGEKEADDIIGAIAKVEQACGK